MRLHTNTYFQYFLLKAFLQSGNYNVLLIDWSTLAAAPWYISAVNNLPTTGKYVARFIRFLVRQSYEVEKIHLIGFSLGAEMAGYIGLQLQKWNITLPRITGIYSLPTNYFFSNFMKFNF